jgi:hypothetical protein
LLYSQLVNRLIHRLALWHYLCSGNVFSDISL